MKTAKIIALESFWLYGIIQIKPITSKTIDCKRMCNKMQQKIKHLYLANTAK